MKSMKSLIAAATLLGAVSIASSAHAVDEYNVSTGTTLSGAGVALRGDDAVALATGLKVMPGQARFTVEHDGVAYYFSSEETMKRFAASPKQYMPQYGGFCAFGVAIGKKLDARNRFAEIVNGRLYLFLNAVAFQKYQEDRSGTLAKAEKNWPVMHRVAVGQVNS
jgi:YHS domain-containing protein